MAAKAVDTDQIIKKALEEEEHEKKLRKAHKAKDVDAIKSLKKGKTLEQLEEEEGGPVKESLISMAHAKRSAKRKGAVADTDLVDDVTRAEEDAELVEDDGVKLEPFNLKDEREKGYFDEAGNYVERDEKDEGEADAWLQSDEAKIVSKDVLKKIEEREKAAAAAEALGPMTAVQIARLQHQISQILEGDETVTQALKRLGVSVRKGPQLKRARPSNAPSSAAAKADPVAQQKFDALTEAASALMDAGELDIYTQNKSYLQRAASVYIDDDEAGPSTLLAGGVSKAVYEDADEDMFGDDDAPAPTAPATSIQETKAAAAVDYASWSVKELRKFLTERGIDPSGMLEKSELVDKVKEVASSAVYPVPPGYEYDAASGMYYSATDGMYYDGKNGGFCTAEGKWYSYDAEKGWVEWQ